MSDSIPTNDLDRAIMKLKKSHGALPEFLRALGEGELWALMPWHPEVEDMDMELKNGMQMPFSVLEDEKGPIVPIFSSFERAREGIKKARLPARTYSVGAVEAKALLTILGSAGLRAEVNKNCKTGGVIIGADAMRDVADGSAFEVKGEVRKNERMKMQILDPADYPTHLVQSLFDVLKQHRNFRAAWIFGRQKGEAQPEGGVGYRLMVLIEPHDAVLLHDLSLVANSACGKLNKVEMGTVPENSGDYTAQLFRAAAPFYVAPDYELPEGAKEL